MTFEYGVLIGLWVGMIIGISFARIMELKRNGFELKWVQNRKVKKREL